MGSGTGTRRTTRNGSIPGPLLQLQLLLLLPSEKRIHQVNVRFYMEVCFMHNSLWGIRSLPDAFSRPAGGGHFGQICYPRDRQRDRDASAAIGWLLTS